MSRLVRNRIDRIFLLSGRNNFFTTARFGIPFVAFGALFLFGRFNFLAAIRFGIQVLPFRTSFWLAIADACLVYAITRVRINDFTFWTITIFLRLVIFARRWLVSQQSCAVKERVGNALLLAVRIICARYNANVDNQLDS